MIEPSDRPRWEDLQRLPTLATKTLDDETGPFRDLACKEGISILLELKLATSDTQHWLCTKGIPRPRRDLPESWVAGYITPAYLQPDGTWRMGFSYSPNSTRRTQGRDSRHLLAEERERIRITAKPENQSPARETSRKRRKLPLLILALAVGIGLAVLVKSIWGW